MGDTETESKLTARHMTLFGVVTLILGIAAIAAPMITGVSVVLSVGLLVIAGGILRMLWAFEAGSFGKGALAFAIGGLTLLCGLALVSEPMYALGILTVVVAAYLFADGIVELVGAFRIRPEMGRAWLLFGGIASILLGTMIWRQFPLSGTWAIGVLLGVKLLIVGTIMIAGGSAVRSFASTRTA
jgi:uncharacterized membrane protein HdeD (DUF308 family)